MASVRLTAHCIGATAAWRPALVPLIEPTLVRLAGQIVPARRTGSVHCVDDGTFWLNGLALDAYAMALTSARPGMQSRQSPRVPV